MWRRFLLTIGITALLPLSVGAQTVDEVIAKNIQAHGGMEKLKAVQSVRVTGKYTQGSFRAGFGGCALQLQSSANGSSTASSFMLRFMAKFHRCQFELGL